MEAFMFKNKFKLFIFMLAIGFVLITLDVNVTTPFKFSIITLHLIIMPGAITKLLTQVQKKLMKIHIIIQQMIIAQPIHQQTPVRARQKLLTTFILEIFQ